MPVKGRGKDQRMSVCESEGEETVSDVLFIWISLCFISTQLSRGSWFGGQGHSLTAQKAESETVREFSEEQEDTKTGKSSLERDKEPEAGIVATVNMFKDG